MPAFSNSASLRSWERKLKYRRKERAKIRHDAGDLVTHEEAAHVKKWDRLIAEAEHMVSLRRKQIADDRPLRLKALAEVNKLVGIMEVGGNNMGRAVLEIIRANGGTGPEAWCGDLVAYVYRKAGSKVVQRGWAAVRLLGFLTGMKVVGVRSMLAGYIIVYSFDHTGIFVEYLRLVNGAYEKCSAAQATHVRAIEGNTGRTGSVSDSSKGGDGVREKIRPINLVSRGVAVTR